MLRILMLRMANSHRLNIFVFMNYVSRSRDVIYLSYDPQLGVKFLCHIVNRVSAERGMGRKRERETVQRGEVRHRIERVAKCLSV